MGMGGNKNGEKIRRKGRIKQPTCGNFYLVQMQKK
jgi:hypothetical protein